jgi:hypothetical protein
MTDVHASLANFVSSVAKCRTMYRNIEEEKTPPLHVATSLHDVSRAQGLEQLYVSFDKINHKHKYKGKLGFCYREAYRLAESDPIFIYCEGYAASEQLSIPLAHAWCVNRETREVYDPVWNNKKVKGNSYCGLPLNLDFVNKVILEVEMYGVLDSLWMCKNLFNTTLGDILHPDYQSVIL